MDSRSTIAKAVTMHKQGEFEKANIAYQRILKTEPDNADVLNYLGMLEFQRGNFDKGIELTERCLNIYPNHSSGCNNLANMYMTTYTVDKAEIYYRKATEIDVQAVEPLYNLGVIEKARKNYTEAENYFNQVLTLNPTHIICMTTLAGMYANLGHAEQAMHILQECLKHEDNEDDQKSTLLSIGRLCRLLDDKQSAIQSYEKCLAIFPNDPTATHMLAALTGEMIPAKPDEKFVKDLFDQFASSFDTILENLDYKAPQHIQNVIDILYQDTEAHSMLVMDAGCGTGLCGNFLKPLASRLIGVDLSPGMLRRARFRDEYDELVEQDLNLYFKKPSEHFDLVISADTLCYFGDLSEFLALSFISMNPGGRLIFTVEKFNSEIPTGFHLESDGRYSQTHSYLIESNQEIECNIENKFKKDIKLERDEPQKGYNLEPHGRYSHTHTYLTESIQQAGYNIEEIIDKDLRLERGKPVEGYLIIAKVPESLKTGT